MLLGGLMERSLANSPNIVCGAGEETWRKTTESHMVPANGQQLKIQRKDGEKTPELQSNVYRETPPTCSLTLAPLWEF